MWSVVDSLPGANIGLARFTCTWLNSCGLYLRSVYLRLSLPILNAYLIFYTDVLVEQRCMHGLLISYQIINVLFFVFSILDDFSVNSTIFHIVRECILKDYKTLSPISLNLFCFISVFICSFVCLFFQQKIDRNYLLKLKWVFFFNYF